MPFTAFLFFYFLLLLLLFSFLFPFFLSFVLLFFFSSSLFSFFFLSFFLLIFFFFFSFSFLFAHKGGEGYVCVQYDFLNSFFVQFLNGSLPNIAFDWKCLYNAFAVQDSKENQFVVQRSERIVVYRSSGFTPFPFYYHSLLP